MIKYFIIEEKNVTRILWMAPHSTEHCSSCVQSMGWSLTIFLNNKMRVKLKNSGLKSFMNSTKTKTKQLLRFRLVWITKKFHFDWHIYKIAKTKAVFLKNAMTIYFILKLHPTSQHGAKIKTNNFSSSFVKS